MNKSVRIDHAVRDSDSVNVEAAPGSLPTRNEPPW
jgi:hypothetical protein